LESLVVAPVSTFGIGEEFVPYLLHFDSEVRLLEAPYSVPNVTPENKEQKGFVQSPQNPAVMYSKKRDELVNIKQSGGFEGLAFDKNNNKLYALLEKVVTGDADQKLRIYEFDLEKQQFTGKVFWYELEDAKHLVGEMSVIRDNDFLVIERDNYRGDEAQFKKIYKVRLDADNATVQKTEVLDLLNINDADNLSGLGSEFRFPYITIESVWAVSPDTLLVCNDNNYPSTGGRDKDLKNDNEFIWVKLPEALY